MYASNNLGYIWDLARKTHVSSIYYDGGHPAFSPDGTYIASTVKDKGLVRIWKQSERGHEHDGADSRDRTNDPIIAISLSPDGHLVATTTDSMLVKVWDVTMDTCLSVFNGAIVKDYPCPSCSVIFSANSMFIAFWSMPMFGSEDTVWIWNVHTHSLVKSIKVELDAHHIALSSDGGRLASVSRDDIIIWDLVLERPIARSEYQYPSVDSYSTPFRLRVDFTVDGNTILITNRNRIDYWCISPASALSPSPFELPMALVHMPSWSCHDQSSSYYEQDGWIVRQDLRRMLWIPPDKRTQMTDSHGEKIIIWSLDGKLYIVDFSSVSLS